MIVVKRIEEFIREDRFETNAYLIYLFNEMKDSVSNHREKNVLETMAINKIVSH